MKIVKCRFLATPLASNPWRKQAIPLILGFGLVIHSVHGILFFHESDPEHNTTAPSGEFANSGWERQGEWGNFLGTPIAPNLFITASHVQGSVGDTFVWQGKEYATIERFDDPDSDVRIWKVCGSFAEFAPLYASRNEVGKTAIVFGRGTQRGEEVNVQDLLGEELKGWRWGEADHRMRWGINQVSEITRDGVGPPLLGSQPNGVGDLLKLPFNQDGGDHEAHLSTGDSGGGLFLNEAGTWKLAGILYAVDGPYNTSNSGQGFNAAVFDEGGLYEGGEGNWSQNPDLPIAQAGSFYATRISSHTDWINQVIEQEQGDSEPILLSTDAPGNEFVPVLEAQVDPASRTIEFPVPQGTSFFILQHCVELEIVSIATLEGSLALKYK